MNSNWAEGFPGNFTRVGSTPELLARIQERGFQVETLEDLRPTLLGDKGYVGCMVKHGGVPEHLWVRTYGSIPAEFRATTAEWLTALLWPDGKPVAEVIVSYYESTLARGPSWIEAASILSWTVGLMGCTGTPDGLLELPADHPLRDGTVLGFDREGGKRNPELTEAELEAMRLIVHGPGPEVRVCHYCKLPLDADERVIQATGNAWAHVTCWYDGGPFEAERRAKEGTADA